ncbi:carbohydrate kinase family protein [Patescibacteria group bacterium]
MKKKIFVSGSIAYDYIMRYKGTFSDTFLSEHLEHINIAFTARDKILHYGGCGGNIAYSLSMLDVNPLLYGVVGTDFNEYEKRLKKNRISLKHIGRSNNDFTATAYVLTDDKENQLTFFAPGAMESMNDEVELNEVDLLDIEIAILSPDVCKRTIKLAHKLMEAEIPYIFDPGQMTPAFELEDLKFLLKSAFGFIANRYEVELLCNRLNINVDDIVNKVPLFIETRGENGSILRKGSETHKIPIAKPDQIEDPTGCGDAFRSGLLFGIMKGYDHVKACKVGALAASYVVENSGTQSHEFKFKHFAKRFEENFGEKL